MRRIIPALFLAAIAPIAITACNDSDSVSPVTNASVSAVDNCDSASFNAGIGPGTCMRGGTTTLASFNSELNGTGTAAGWRFDPTTLTIRCGQAITVTNLGGEEHTFTEVEQFGGGIVPSLNSASNNPTEASECADLPSNARIAPGATFTTEPETEIGVHRYQCCIHPWMRTTVNVTG
jgi:plastocyanin